MGPVDALHSAFDPGRRPQSISVSCPVRWAARAPGFEGVMITRRGPSAHFGTGWQPHRPEKPDFRAFGAHGALTSPGAVANLSRIEPALAVSPEPKGRKRSRLTWTDATARSRCWCSESSRARSLTAFALR